MMQRWSHQRGHRHNGKPPWQISYHLGQMNTGQTFVSGFIRGFHKHFKSDKQCLNGPNKTKTIGDRGSPREHWECRCPPGKTSTKQGITGSNADVHPRRVSHTQMETQNYTHHHPPQEDPTSTGGKPQGLHPHENKIQGPRESQGPKLDLQITAERDLLDPTIQLFNMGKREEKTKRSQTYETTTSSWYIIRKILWYPRNRPSIQKNLGPQVGPLHTV